MSDDPVRNGISRLDEMMSGDVRSTLRLISLMVAYTLLYSVSVYLIIDNGVTPKSTHRELTGSIVLCRVL